MIKKTNHYPVSLATINRRKKKKRKSNIEREGLLPAALCLRPNHGSADIQHHSTPSFVKLLD